MRQEKDLKRVGRSVKRSFIPRSADPCSTRSLDRPIFLTGFMGVGKTKVGRILAGRLGRRFIDTDRLIEETAGRSIPEIFAQEGEEGFRRIEHICVVRAAQTPGAVIALGGGAVTREENWAVIRRSGPCVCLWATPETIFARVSRRDARPLLAGLTDAERLARIKCMLQEREPFYRRADITVTSSDDCSPEETAEDIIAQLEARGEL